MAPCATCVTSWASGSCRSAYANGDTQPDTTVDTQANTQANATGDTTRTYPHYSTRQRTPRLAAACRAAGQPVPRTRAETVRCILDSLAEAYRRTLTEAAELSGKRIDVVHV